MLAVTKNAPKKSIIQLGEAFKSFFAGRNAYPTYRKKGIEGFSEFRDQFEYKALMRGGIVVADRWFASSKLCSFCGERNTSLTLSIRQWTCCQCGTTHDRDINAAINLTERLLADREFIGADWFRWLK